MTQPAVSPIVEFEEAIKPFRTTWRSVDVRALCDLRNNLLLSMVACLTPEEPRPLETIEQIEEVAFIRGSFPIAGLNTLLAGLRTGTIRLESHSLSTQDFDDFRFRGLDRSRDEDLSRGWQELRDFSHFSLWGWCRRSLDVMTAPRELWAAARVQGFSSFGELSLSRLQFEVGSLKSPGVNIFAPVMSSIEAQIDRGQTLFQIRFPGALNADSLFLVYRIQDARGNRLGGDQITASKLQLTRDEAWASLRGSIPMPLESARVELRTFFREYRSGNEAVTSEFLEVPLPEGKENPRWNVLQSLIANTRVWAKGPGFKSEEALRQWLGLVPPRPEQASFERGVNCLLWLSGCSLVYIGPAEGVDFALHVTGSRDIIVLLSCTTSPDLRAKFATLRLQANRAKERGLGKGGVIAAVIAPVEREDLTVRATQEASESGIRLILLPQLKELFERAVGRDWENAHELLMAYVEGPRGTGA